MAVRSTCWSIGSTANSSSKPSRSEDEDIGDFQTFYHEVRRATARLQATESEETLCQVAADEVRRIIGYDRVMVYRFDADWNGR